MDTLGTEHRRIEALFAVGYRYQTEGAFRKAEGAYREVIRRRPGHVSAHNNLGNCLRSLGEFEAAIRCFDRALALEPGKSGAKLNKALALLSLGRYDEAWPLYRARFAAIDCRRQLRESGKPEWDGAPLRADQRLLLYGNQGLGDELQNLRYLPLVIRRVPRLILEVQRPLHRLVREMPGLENVVVRARNAEPPPACELHCELFELPRLFGTTPESIPPPWLPPFARDERVRQFFRRERETRPGAFRVGLVWSGNPRNDLNRFRACGLGHLLPLIATPGCRFYSLQKGPPRQDLARFGAGAEIADLDELTTDLAATATAMEELDLVITTDTSVPHLAGALGIEAWVLLHFPADWRWSLHGERSPWYPALRLFRRTREKDWRGVVAEVGADLQARLDQVA